MRYIRVTTDITILGLKTGQILEAKVIFRDGMQDEMARLKIPLTSCLRQYTDIDGSFYKWGVGFECNKTWWTEVSPLEALAMQADD